MSLTRQSARTSPFRSMRSTGSGSRRAVNTGWKEAYEEPAVERARWFEPM